MRLRLCIVMLFTSLVACSTNVWSSPMPEIIENLVDTLRDSSVVGDGRMAIIVSRGANTPSGEKKLIILDNKSSHALSFEGLLDARWSTADQLVIWNKEGIVAINNQGEFRRNLFPRDSHFVLPVPAANGKWLALEKYDPQKGGQSLAVFDLSAGNKFVYDFDYKNLRKEIAKGPIGFGSVVWSPDGNHLALQLNVGEDKNPGLQTRRIGVLDLRTSAIQVLYDSVYRVSPLFWLHDGIYGRSESNLKVNGLLRCDVEGKGCSLVYEPGEGKFVSLGAAIGHGRALLLVGDRNIDPFEVRAKEIHVVDLTTGKGQVLIRLPKDAFVNALDWISR